MAISILVENIKCGGCANSIQRGLQEDPRVKSVQVTVEEGLVEVEADEAVRPELVARLDKNGDGKVNLAVTPRGERHNLAKLGDPEVDTVEGAARLKAKAKSFVSCAIGRLDK